jgi:uncharacterized protein (TIGR02231 family)
MDTPLVADIVAVTVYPGQARITRRGTVSVAAGAQRVLAGGLALGLRADSVRVNGRGPATVLGVDVVAEHHPRTPDATVDELEKRREALQNRLTELNDENTVLDSREGLIESLVRRCGTTFARMVTESGDTDRVAAVNDALAGQLAAVLAARRELAERRREAQLEFDALGRRLGELQAQRAPDRMAVAVDLEAERAGEIELEVSYLVDAARWESRYDVRLHGDSLTLTWFGLITQHSGEDWPECDLRLSTARPANAVTVPELDPWYLDRHEPMVERSRMPVPAAPAAAAYDQLESAVPLAQAIASVEHGVTAATYQPTRRVAVPSDGTSHRTTVAVAELPARLDHLTVPLRGPEAYLRATAVNSSEHTLRPGPAAIFHETEFVGTTTLEPWAPGEEVELALGVDDRVRVERELVRRAAGKTVLGGTRRNEAAYRITVGNYGPRPAKVTVVDQVPVSRDEAIVVRDVQLDPKPAERSELGEVTWKLVLDPGASAELTLGFRVDVAKGVRLAGWRD